MKPVLLVRRSLASKYELRFAEKYFPIVESRVECRDCLVIGRYSVLPFYDELDRDLRLVDSRLVNSLDEHRWIVSFDYYRELKDYTPESWLEEDFPSCAHSGPFVVKGRMSSKKRQWNTHMFAPSKREALEVAKRLKDESGGWTLIELNDGQTAVPSENDLDELYGNLHRAVAGA